MESKLTEPRPPGLRDRILHLPGRAERPLCPEILGGAAAPPYRGREDFCHAPAGRDRVAFL